MAYKDPEKQRQCDRDRHREYMRAWREKRGDDYRTRYWVGTLKRKYGLTVEQFDALLDGQKGCCAACRTNLIRSVGNHLVVDHCHKSNKVRGLLCDACNRTIGHAKEDIDRLVACAVYLEDKK